MFNRIVMTAGVSVLFTRSNLLAEDLKPFYQDERVNDEEPLDKDAVKAVFLECKQLIETRIRQVEGYLDSLSVEVSLLNALKERNSLESAPKVSFIVSSTGTGYLASLINKHLLESLYGADVSIDIVEDLRVDSKVSMKRSIAYFMDKVYERLSEGEPNTTCFAPVGGYKVMTSYGTFIGSMMDFPTCYMHEGSKYLHVIPPTPIDLSESFVEEHKELLRMVFQEKTVDLATLSHSDKQAVLKQPAIFQKEKVDKDHCVSLTLMANFLLQRGKFRDYVNPSVYISKDALKAFESEGDTKKWVEGKLKTMLAKPESAKDLYHDREFHSLDRKKVKNNLYKSPDPNQVFRCTWFKEGKDIYIEKIWLDHALYEREAGNGVGLYTREKDRPNGETFYVNYQID